MQASPRVFFPDRPVDWEGDLLWHDDPLKTQISLIAENLVTPLRADRADPLARSESLTFAVHGKWGRGKSSVLRMVRDRAEHLAREHEVLDRLRFCDYLAPAYESLAYDVRTTLTMRILTALKGNALEAIDALLPHAMAVVPREERSGYLPREVEGTSWTSAALETLVGTLARLVDFDRLIGELLTPPGEDSRVLVVVIDDLDRCRREFVWKVLDTIQQLSGVRNLFFILAVDQEQLREVVRERGLGEGEGDGAGDPDFALEKYVQLSLWVPEMDAAHLERYVHALLGQPAGVGSQADLVRQTLIGNVRLLRYGLRVATPRSVKRCLNILRTDLAHRLTDVLGPQQEALMMKERILQYRWPDFARTELLPAREDPNGMERLAFHALEGAAAEFRNSGDLPRLRFELQRRSAFHTRPGWEALELDLVRFLGEPPYWFLREAEGEETGRGSYFRWVFGVPEAPREEQAVPETLALSQNPFSRQAEAGQLAGRLHDLYTVAEVHAGSGRVEEARSALRELAQTALGALNSGTGVLHARNAPLVGNAALTAERVSDPEIAYHLHRAAIALDADHPNIAQNYVEFLLDHQVAQEYSYAEAALARLADEFADHKPERTRELRLRLLRQLGAVVDPEEVQAVVDGFTRSNRNEVSFRNLWRTLRELGEWEALRAVARMRMEAASTPDERYRVLRYLVDALAAAPKPAEEDEALLLYRYLLERAVPRSPEAATDQIDVQHNFAVLLSHRGYLHLANRLWFRCYAERPEDPDVRRVYAAFLVRHGFAEYAARVTQGEPLEQVPELPGPERVPEVYEERGTARWWESTFTSPGEGPAAGG